MEDWGAVREREARGCTPRLTIAPCELDEANEFVRLHHRHHRPVVGGYKFALSVLDGERVCGVAIAGLPVSRLLADGWTLEVRRVATDGTPNACSALYGAARRAAFALGYKRLLTYTLPSEGGASLCAELAGSYWAKRAVGHGIAKLARE